MRMCSAIAWLILIDYHPPTHLTLTAVFYTHTHSLSLCFLPFPLFLLLILNSHPPLSFARFPFNLFRSFIQPSSLSIHLSSTLSLSISLLQVIYRAAQQYRSISTESVWGIIITMRWKRHCGEREGEKRRKRERREKSGEQAVVPSGCANRQANTRRYTDVDYSALTAAVGSSSECNTVKDGDVHQCPLVAKVTHCQTVTAMTSDHLTAIHTDFAIGCSLGFLYFLRNIFQNMLTVLIWCLFWWNVMFSLLKLIFFT